MRSNHRFNKTVMRLKDVYIEAFRNVQTGTARAVSLFISFVVLVGSVAIIHTLFVVDSSKQARQFQEAWASTFMLDSFDNIDAFACDTLAMSDGVQASGALKSQESIHFAKAPSWSVATWVVTPGMATVLAIEPLVTDMKNIWVSEPLAERLGIRVGDQLEIYNPESSTESEGVVSVVVSAVYQYPEDGRDQLFAESVMVPDRGLSNMDTCIASLWPDTSSAQLWLGLSVIQNHDSGNSISTQINQLNRTLGSTFKIPNLTPHFFTGFAVLAGFVPPIIAWRVRRLEFASMLHSKVSRSTIMGILTFEWLWWAIPSFLISSLAIFLAAKIDNPDPFAPAFVSGFLTLVAGTCASYLVVTYYALTAKESRLFKLFRTR